MTDVRRRSRREPALHLHTRPATILTAVALCVLIVLIQFMPAIQDAALRAPGAH